MDISEIRAALRFNDNAGTMQTLVRTALDDIADSVVNLALSYNHPINELMENVYELFYNFYEHLSKETLRDSGNKRAISATEDANEQLFDVIIHSSEGAVAQCYYDLQRAPKELVSQLSCAEFWEVLTSYISPKIAVFDKAYDMEQDYVSHHYMTQYTFYIFNAGIYGFEQGKFSKDDVMALVRTCNHMSPQWINVAIDKVTGFSDSTNRENFHIHNYYYYLNSHKFLIDYIVSNYIVNNSADNSVDIGLDLWLNIHFECESSEIDFAEGVVLNSKLYDYNKMLITALHDAEKERE